MGLRSNVEANKWDSYESPMPFGGESTWDHELASEVETEFVYVTNAFRRGVHLGPP